jgi:fibronectin-binding autotransporter adhesin
MADRYWVGGTGSWSSTAKWSTTSGGASGASVPTSSDNAIFDANSAAAHYTVTVTDNATCADLTFTPVAADGVTQFAVGVNFVIAGTFSTSGTQGNRRAWFRSSTESLMRDVSIATIGTVTDVDFRDIRITGAGGTLTGTRIGDLKGNVGITFSAPKTCYRIGAGNWSDDQWAATSGGTPSTDFFPLAQDTAVIDESTASGTHVFNSLVQYTGTVDMSARTTALSCQNATNFYVYGNLTLGSGITMVTSGSSFWFVGRGSQVITSAGVALSTGVAINPFVGTVELADALNIGAQGLVIYSGTFDTNGYNVTAGALSSSNSGVREIRLGASTVTLSNAVTLTTTTNMTFDAGTSSIVLIPTNATFSGGGLVFYDVSFSSLGTGTHVVNQSNTFNSLSINAPTVNGVRQLAFGADQTITGTLTAAGSSPILRTMLRSITTSTPRTLTVGTLLADYCDFRDITIAGTAAGGSPTNAGDCGGNSGVTFPAPKTVYWNLAGTQNWPATGWATTSGGTPDAANFPLAQDTCIFDDTGSVGQVTLAALYNIGVMDMSARTTAMTLQANVAVSLYGSWTFGSGVTFAGTGDLTFSGRGTSTITSNGVPFTGEIAIDCGTGTVQLADALETSSNRTFRIRSGTFDAVNYNVTMGLFAGNSISTGLTTLKMGSGTWTCSGTGTVWNATSSLVLYKGTADILLSSVSTNARSFRGGSNLSYNKLTIGGATGVSTLTFTDAGNQFTEFASTKTVAHTIAFGTAQVTIGKWSVTGTAGNVVTVTGTNGAGSIRINGSRVSGVDYLAMGTTKLVTTGLLASPAEFYAGANSTGTGDGIILDDAPTPVTRYWVGGTGTWNATTTNWSATSGGAGGASVPTSADAVIFDSASNATDYTVTISTIPARCGALTVNGPASGTVTLGSSTSNPFFVHDDITFAATGLASLFNMSGGIVLSGSAAGRTVTTNGVTVTANTGNPTVDGVGSSWTLGGAANFGNNAGLTLKAGSFSTANYSVQLPSMALFGKGTTSLSLGSSTVTMLGSSNAVNFGTTDAAKVNFTFDAGTSLLDLVVNNLNFQGNGQTFYDVALTGAGNINTTSISGDNTFNNLSIVGRSTVGISNRTINGNQTINGTLTLSAGTNATMRTFVKSSVIGTTRTLTCAAVAALTDIDFRDITIAGAAVSGGNLTGTRLGNCKGNSGITFVAGADKYWNFAGGGNWSSTAWATSSGGAVSNDNFPLAQDTIIFEAGNPNSGATVTINAGYNIGTIDMSARTTNTMTLGTGGNAPSIYGNWINGTGVTFSGTGTLTFAGRGSHTITSAGRTFTQEFSINTPGGSVTLQDALETNRSATGAVALTLGTLDANNYNVTLSGASSSLSSANSNTRTIAVGSGTWTIAGSGNSWNTSAASNLTVTGTGTVSQTSASAKVFSGGSVDYSGITVNQGGAGQLTVTGNNTFANITNTYSATGATTIAFGTTTQRVADFTATGTAGNVLTIQGTSATSPCTLIHTGAGDISIDYVTITGVRAYQI